jgi:antitoxin (DNA-binding transcriptional repressor) of toxin-antitoxin stability system
MTYTMSLNDALSQLHKLLPLTQAGGEIIIVEDNKPVAKLIPLPVTEEAGSAETGKKRIFGLHRGQIWVSEDFDDPLPDDFWLGEA